MRKAWTFTLLAIAFGAMRAEAAPKRVAVASIAVAHAVPGAPGFLIADELADRLALASGMAVADREHVREAEEAIGLAGHEDDPQKLTALAARLKVDLIIGGHADGKRLSLRWVDPAAGSVDEIAAEAASARADRLAIAAIQKLLDGKKIDAPATSRTGMLAVDGAGGDAAYLAYARAAERAAARDFATADHGLAEATRSDPHLGRALALAAWVRLKMKDYPGASSLAKAARDAAALSRGCRLMAARADDYADRVDAAIEGYRAVLAIAANDAVAHGNLGRLLAAKKRDLAGAVKEDLAATTCEPAWPLARFNLAVARLDFGDVAAAIDGLEKLVEESPDAAQYSVTLGRAYRRAGRAGAAVKLLGPVVKAVPGDVGARSELALSLGDSGDLPAARALLAAAPNPNEGFLVVARGQLDLLAGDAAAAESTLAAISDGAAPAVRREARLALGAARMRSGPAAALQVYQQLVDEDPLDAEAQYDLGLALVMSNHPEGADHLRRALAIAPRMAVAAVALARWLLATGDPRGAASVAGAARDAGADDPRLLAALGQALVASGSPAPAIDPLRAAAAADGPARSDALYLLAEAHFSLGHRDEARAAAQRYLTVENRADRAGPLARARELAR